MQATAALTRIARTGTEPATQRLAAARALAKLKTEGLEPLVAELAKRFAGPDAAE